MKQTPYPCPACKGHGCKMCDKVGTLAGWNARKVREAAEYTGTGDWICRVTSHNFDKAPMWNKKPLDKTEKKK